MMQKTRAFDFSLKSVNDAGEFAGYVSVYGVVDSYRERVAPGAFKESLAARAARGRKFPILFQHDHSQPIGTWTRLEEDSKGLYGEGALWLDDSPTARIVHRGLSDTAIDGLSIGFYDQEWSWDEKTRIRTLDKVELVEASVVLSPANDAARVDSVKAKLAAGEELSLREFEGLLRERGFSRAEAKDIAAFGFDGWSRRESGSSEANIATGLVDQLRSFSLPTI